MQSFRYCRLCFQSLALLPALITPQIACGQNPNDQLGVTVQQPTLGVSIDSAGVLSTKVFPDAGGQLIQARLNAARKNLPSQLQKRSTCRKISLRRLEEALAGKIENGDTIPNAMESLAGLMKIEYVFVVPDENDIIIAGPAEPWIENASGRSVGIYSAAPTILLQDIASALRVFAPSQKLQSWVACSIDPTANGLNELQKFQKRLPRQVSQNVQAEAAVEFANQMQQSLGLASVKVYGIDPRSHAARVMIEADYRMKMIAVGLELPPIEMTTFIEALHGAPKNLQRWWLTPNYKCLRQTDDQLSVQMIGRGVRLQTENIAFGPGARINRKSNKPSRAARTYASSFTKNYEKLAAVRPVFAQLRNVIDCLVAAAWIHKNSGYERADWHPELLVDESRYPVNHLENVRQAQCVANAVWKRNVLILPAGGGVSIQASDALKEENLDSDSAGALMKIADSIDVPGDDSWWWD